MDPRSLTRQPPLDPVVERDLARAVRSGDVEARDALVRSGLRLVALRALSLGFVGPAFDDALQDGTEGLLKAVDRFDPDRGAALATFAWPWITGAILKGARVRRVDLPAVAEADPGPGSTAGLDVSHALDELPPAQARAVRLRFGLGDHDAAPLTRREVAQALGVSEPAARRLEDRAVQHLRRRLATVGDRASRSREADPL
ncbi:sigma-70 family RNA polymerase sigma factor [Aeromicrobium sp. Root495]|uniref:sigma-70 family RNA polymerase sigma factor n=1 Tax=Aeromicrobium sp. Root495 TaxID=1736550 RepID=UPI00138F1F5B|nr:sigma-70 family RNA polymerase sigma factor [Aeromicrobium sp. Root495]